MAPRLGMRLLWDYCETCKVPSFLDRKEMTNETRGLDSIACPSCRSGAQGWQSSSFRWYGIYVFVRGWSLERAHIRTGCAQWPMRHCIHTHHQPNIKLEVNWNSPISPLITTVLKCVTWHVLPPHLYVMKGPIRHSPIWSVSVEEELVFFQCQREWRGWSVGASSSLLEVEKKKWRVSHMLHVTSICQQIYISRNIS